MSDKFDVACKMLPGHSVKKKKKKIESLQQKSTIIIIVCRMCIQQVDNACMIENKQVH